MCAVWDCFSKPLDIRLDLVLKKKQNKKTFTNIFDDARDHCWTQRFNETRRHFPAGLWQQNWIFLMRRLQMRDHCWRLHFNIYWCETTKCFSRRHWDTFFFFFMVCGNITDIFDGMSAKLESKCETWKCEYIWPNIFQLYLWRQNKVFQAKIWPFPYSNQVMFVLNITIFHYLLLLMSL